MLQGGAHTNRAVLVFEGNTVLEVVDSKDFPQSREASEGPDRTTAKHVVSHARIGVYMRTETLQKALC